LIRKISAPLGEQKLKDTLNELYALCDENLEPGSEKGNFYLNSVTDFVEAARTISLTNSPALMQMLLGFERFDEFYVSCPNEGQIRNKPGYRIKHSTIRGPSKGGLRIDPIVNFSEVAALSFMMTWKSARSRILFGGAKGGLMLDPREYDPKSIDFFDSLSNFGRSLFLVTGPARDVPAGDVGCGADEIGRMFEGFKSALRDLALMAGGVRHNVTMIGDQIISLEEARLILQEAFNIDYDDRKILRELSANQEYLELVVAAQITGKPKMGIQARTGATGRGLCYAALAVVTNLYLEGKWKASEPLKPREKALLEKTASITVPLILEKRGELLISDEEWKELTGVIYPKLFRDKTMVVQGSGKVGSSIIQEMVPFGVNLIALSDAGGAVMGDHLDSEALLQAVEDSRSLEDPRSRASVIHCTKNVSRIIKGAAEGSEILELECDLLFPAALENAVTEKNAHQIKAKVEICGSNGTNSSKAEKILHEKGVTVVYDFLANSAGVAASYFEWLRNLSQRARYEAEVINKKPYDISVMEKYIMPEFKERILGILAKDESRQVTDEWNTILRDIMISAVNEDSHTALSQGISLKTAGFIDAQLRVLAASLAPLNSSKRESLLAGLPEDTLGRLKEYEKHPEVALFKPEN
jgi:glutamate dehydrogenase/leucine dehydrogenase